MSDLMDFRHPYPLATRTYPVSFLITLFFILMYLQQHWIYVLCTFIEVYLIYNIIEVSGVQHSDSVFSLIVVH